MARLASILLAMGLVLSAGPSTGEEDTFADLPHILNALNTALESSPSGVQVPWENPSTGHHGVITPSQAFETESGQVCREFERTWVFSGSTTAYKGTACRQPTGLWQIREESQVSYAAVTRRPEPPRDSGQPTYSQGSELTAEIQRLLTQLGYDPGPADGVYGPQTRAAIEAFQRHEGLPVDGQVSDALLAHMEMVVSAHATASRTPARVSATETATPSSASALAGAKQDELKARLINALEELDWAISAKIDSDVETTARAFSDAYDIEQSRRIADFVLAPLTVIEQAIGTLAFAKSAPEIVTSLNRAESVLEIASLLMGIGQLQQVGQDLQLAMDGTTYGSLAETMLNEAAQSSVPGEYAATIKLHLYGIGGRQSPVWARHFMGEKAEMVWGAREVKRQISDQIARLAKEISESNVPPDLEAEGIVARLADITTAIRRSKSGNFTLSLDTTSEAQPSSVAAFQLGSIGSLEQVRREALGHYDSDLRMKQSVVITSVIKAGVEAVTLYVGYKSETGQLLAEAHREVLTPVSVLQAALSRTYTTNARQQINGLPHEMLLALPTEISNVWTVVDETLNYVRTAVHRPTVTSSQSEEAGEVPEFGQSDVLGLTLSTITPELRERYNLDENLKGVVITDVAVASDAADKGLRPGDIIVEVSQQEVAARAEVEKTITAARDAGRKSVLLLVERKGNMQFVPLQVAVASVPKPKRAERASPGESQRTPSESPFEDFFRRHLPQKSRESVTAQTLDEEPGWIGVRLQADRDAAIIASVTDGSPADEAGLKPGDEILAINNRSITDAKELAEIVASLRPGDKVTLEVLRGSEHVDVSLVLGTKSSRVANFDVFGVKLYMTPDEVINALKSQHPDARIGIEKRVCLKAQIRQINEGIRLPADCVRSITVVEDLGNGEKYDVTIDFVEDAPDNFGKSIVTNVNYEFRFSRKKVVSHDDFRTSLIEKFGQPDWIKPDRASGNRENELWWGTFKPRAKEIKREWECFDRGPSGSPHSWGTDCVGMLPSSIPIDEFQPYLYFPLPGATSYELELADRGRVTRYYSWKEEFIKDQTVSKTKPRF